MSYNVHFLNNKYTCVNDLLAYMQKVEANLIQGNT